MTRRVSGRVLWANLHLLFWLSLVPFVTGWMGETGNAPFPTACYGAVLLLAGGGYLILARGIIAAEGGGSKLAVAMGRDIKGKVSAVMYAAAIPLSFVHVFIADAIYVIVALLWLVPDSRLERHMQQDGA